MSKYSGRSDMADWCEMHNDPQTIVDGYKVFARCNDIVPLKIESAKDLVPYYPYLIVTMSCHDNTGVICLSDRSFIDIEEADHLNLRLNEVKRYWRRCKRKKIPFRIEEVSQYLYPYLRQDYDLEIIKRVAEQGKNATINGIHTPIHEMYRQRWLDKMIEVGWDRNSAYRWIYGLDRWLKIDERIKR